MKGYKVFNPNWMCRGFQYSLGEIFEEDITPQCCDRGFHFCTDLKDCFSYYAFSPLNKVAEIEALGEIDIKPEINKYCTNKIKIVRELSWDEVLRMVNTGKNNTGLGNTGNDNNGYYNSGFYNNGDYNSGYCNCGYYNSGDCNNGDYNCGDWNNTNFSNGCFNTEEQKIFMFNKPSDWTLRDWKQSEASMMLDSLQRNSLQFISINMINGKKEQSPKHKLADWYLKRSECNQFWWDTLSDHEKDIIKSLPNFDAVIFKRITGINVNKDLHD